MKRTAVALGLSNTAFIQTNTCGANLAANASCTVTVTFAPNAAGTVSANLTANTSAGNVSAVLTGTGALPIRRRYTLLIPTQGTRTAATNPQTAKKAMQRAHLVVRC